MKHLSKYNWKDNFLFFVFFIFIIIICISLIITGCKFDRLGLYKENTESAAVETTVPVTPGPYTEEYFYEMKGKQLNKNTLADINVRRAIMYAIDRQRIVGELLNGYGGVLNSLFHKDSDYYYPAWSKYNYDLYKAKEHLELAGYGKDNPLYLTIGASESSNARQIIEDIIKEDLEKIGIKIWIENKQSREWYLDYVENGNYELGIWSLYTPDCESILNYFSSDKIPIHETDTNKSCNNYYWYDNGQVDALITKLVNEDLFEEKVEITEQIQDKIAEDAVILPLFNRIFAVAYNNKIQNLEVSRSDGSFLINIQNMDITGQPTPIEIESTEDEEIESGDKTKETEDTNFKSMVVGYEQEPYVLNPLVSDNACRDFINSLIVCGLWEKKDDGRYEPLLVDSVTTGNEDANIKSELRYSLKANIKLKDNIFWEDYSPITSHDVVATINAIIEDESLKYSEKNYMAIKSIEAVDDKEFIVIFNEYDNNWKDLFSIIFPKNKLNHGYISEIFNDDIFGCGQFRLREWVKGEYIVIEKNYYYHGEKPEIDAIKFLFNSDINYLINMLKEGNIDILSIPADIGLMQEIEENEELDLIVENGNLWEHLAICLKSKQG